MEIFKTIMIESKSGHFRVGFIMGYDYAAWDIGHFFRGIRIYPVFHFEAICIKL